MLGGAGALVAVGILAYWTMNAPRGVEGQGRATATPGVCDEGSNFSRWEDEEAFLV